MSKPIKMPPEPITNGRLRYAPQAKDETREEAFARQTEAFIKMRRLMDYTRARRDGSDC